MTLCNFWAKTNEISAFFLLDSSCWVRKPKLALPVGRPPGQNPKCCSWNFIQLQGLWTTSSRIGQRPANMPLDHKHRQTQVNPVRTHRPEKNNPTVLTKFPAYKILSRETYTWAEHAQKLLLSLRNQINVSGISISHGLLWKHEKWDNTPTMSYEFCSFQVCWNTTKVLLQHWL